MKIIILNKKAKMYFINILILSTINKLSSLIIFAVIIRKFYFYLG